MCLKRAKDRRKEGVEENEIKRSEEGSKVLKEGEKREESRPNAPRSTMTPQNRMKVNINGNWTRKDRKIGH